MISPLKNIGCLLLFEKSGCFPLDKSIIDNLCIAKVQYSLE
jgi:hypothetical protein